MDKEVTMTSGPADYITLDDVTRSFITANADAFDNGIYRPQAGKIGRFAGGFADAMRETRKLKDSLMIFGGQGAMTIGGLFGEESGLSEWGKEIVRAGSRQIAAIDAENAKKSDLADYEKDTFAYKLGGGFASVVQMLIAGYLTGGAASAAGAGVKAVQGAQKIGALVAGASQEISSETQEGVKNYREKTGDKDLQNYTTGEARKEFLSTAGYGAASTALESLNLSRVMPFLKEGKKVIPNFWKGAVSEGSTEMLQELANIGFDLVDGTIDFSKMPERLYGMFEQGVIGGLVGGTTAGAFSIKNRAQIKNYLRGELAGVVPEKDLNSVVNKLYEDGIDTMAGVVTAELSESESLRNKHGDIYRAMMTAIEKAATQSGAFADEAARAAYVSETAAMFADQVLAEANFRKVAIDEVLKASDIVFEDGGIKFKTGTQVFDDAGNVLEQAMYPSNKPDFSSFYDYAQTKPEKKSYYDLSLGDLSLRIPQDVTIHDKNDHSLTEPEWNGVFEGMKNPIEARVSLTPNSYGKITALLKIKANGRLYGVSVTLAGKNNYISTAFKTTDAGYIDWVNKKKTSDMPAPKNPARSSPVKHGDVIIGKSLNEIISNLRSEVNDDILYQSAFAGSRVDYDKPSLEAINSGEGAQVHGWGLYYALDKDVAEGYREQRLSEIKQNYDVDYKGQSLYDLFRDDELLVGGLVSRIKYKPDYEVRNYINDRLELYKRYIREDKIADEDLEDTKHVIGVLENLSKELYENRVDDVFHIEHGQVHEVDIPENPYLLDEQKPFSDQSDFVREKIEQIIKEKGLSNYFTVPQIESQDVSILENLSGRDIYDIFSKYSGSEKAASELLSKYGVKGITYEGGRDGRCFVIFDDKDVKVIQKFYQGMAGGGVKGSYSPYNRLLKITEKADYSTLPHEFAHFWLSEMEGWVNSGLASEDYLKRYNIAMDWLKAEAGKPLSRRAQEQFARGYEQYLLNGNLPESPMNPVYAEYDRWLKAVYDDLNQPSKKPLTTDMVRFFQSMTTGTLPETVLPPVNVDRREKKETENVGSEGVSKMETTTESVGNLPPVAVEAKDGKVSAAAERQNRLNKISGLLKEDPQNVFYEPITLEKSAQQAEMLIERDGLDGVRDMIDGEKPMPENVIRTAVLIAYEQEMLKQGNTAEYLRVLRKHTLEQTRRGQEISAERINQDITNPSYWAKQALLGRKNSLADNIFERIKKEGDSKEKAVDRFVAETAAEYAEKLEQSADKDAVIKELNMKIKSITGEQMELFQKESVAGKTYDAVYDEIGRWIEECFDVSISAEEMNVLKEKTDELARSFTAGLKPGQNPSVEAMRKIREMRETVAAMNPTNWLSLAVNSYGRAAMLSSPKSAVLNILSNAETYVTEAITRRIANGSFEKAVDSKAISDYLKYDYDVYRTSGVMMSVVRPEEILDPARRLLGENVMSSAGAGNFRKGVRFMERLIFDWSLGAPDAKSKALSFVDNAALEATKTAKAEGLTGKALTERATALFKDACLYQPVTADGISIRNNSINAAEVATFTNDGKISKMSGNVRNLINAATGKVRLGDFVMPFVKTPANVVALGMEYSFGLGTAALHLPQILADVRAGTLSEVSRNVIRSSIRNGIGMALAALIASLFDPEDYISSFALASQKERDLVRFKNGVYNSIKIGGKYVSLDYFGPLGAPLVGWFEAKKAKGAVEKVASFLKAAGQQFGNVPGIKELASLTGWIDKAVAQPTEKTLEDLWNGTTDQILARTVPAIVSDIAKIADPYERVSEDGVVGALSAKIPVAREALTAKADMSAGKEKESEGALSVLLFGARVKTAADNDVAREIRRLSDAGEIPQLSDVARSFKGLTDKGKARLRLEFVKGFVNQWGNQVDGYSERVSRLIGTDAYRSKTDAQKKEAINKIRQKMMKELKRKYGGT